MQALFSQRPSLGEEHQFWRVARMVTILIQFLRLPWQEDNPWATDAVERHGLWRCEKCVRDLKWPKERYSVSCSGGQSGQEDSPLRQCSTSLTTTTTLVLLVSELFSFDRLELYSFRKMKCSKLFLIHLILFGVLSSVSVGRHHKTHHTKKSNRSSKVHGHTTKTHRNRASSNLLLQEYIPKRSARNRRDQGTVLYFNINAKKINTELYNKWYTDIKSGD